MNLSQTWSFIVDLVENFHEQFVPIEKMFLGYDNECNLNAFWENQAKQFPHSPVATVVDNIKKVHDRLRVKNDKPSWQRGKLNPDNYPEMTGVNTECAEQFFAHLLCFVFTFKNTSMLRAPF